MKLYRKKLDSLEALRREKIRLRYERKQTKVSDLNPIAEIGGKKMSGEAKAGLIGTLIALAGSKSQLHTAMSLGRPLWNIMRKRRANAKAREYEARFAAALPRKQSALKKIFTEIAVSYIIGKAVQISVQGIRLYMRRRKAAKMKHG